MIYFIVRLLFGLINFNMYLNFTYESFHLCTPKIKKSLKDSVWIKHFCLINTPVGANDGKVWKNPISYLCWVQWRGSHYWRQSTQELFQASRCSSWNIGLFELAFEWHVSCCVVSLALFFLLPPFQGAESSDMGCSSPSSTTPIPTREWGSLACRIHASLSAS